MGIWQQPTMQLGTYYVLCNSWMLSPNVPERGLQKEMSEEIGGDAKLR